MEYFAANSAQKIVTEVVLGPWRRLQRSVLVRSPTLERSMSRSAPENIELKRRHSVEHFAARLREDCKQL
jgi:hypothetical protein